MQDHQEAITYDLLKVGRDLTDIGTPDLPWTVAEAFVMQASQDRDTALHRGMIGEEHVWGLAEQLLAATVDVLNRGNWQRGGGKGPKPKPLPRPGVGGSRSRKVSGGTAVPLSQAEKLFARHNPSAFTVGEAPEGDRSGSAEQPTLPEDVTRPQ